MKNLTTILMNYLRMFITRVFQTGLNNLTKKITNQLHSKKHTNQTPLAFLIVGLLGVSTKAQTYQWGASVGSTGSDIGIAIAKDGAGNIYTTGTFTGTVDFDPGVGVISLTSPFSTTDCFIQKLSPAGALIWAKKIGGSANDIGRAISIDNLGNILIGGDCQPGCDFDPGATTYTLPVAGNTNGFITKLDNAGNFVWAKIFTSANESHIYAITTSSNNEVVAGGNFNDVTDFNPNAGTFTLTTPGGGLDACILKLDASGSFVWAGAFGAPLETDQITSVATDPAGDVYSTGFFKNTADFDIGVGTFNMTAPGTNANDCFISKISNSGNFIWAKQIGGGQFDNGFSIKVNKYNDVLIGGSIRGVIDLDPGTSVQSYTTNASSVDAFLLKLDPSGNYSWAKVFNGPSDEFISSLDTDPFGNVYAVGNFSATVDFDPSLASYTLASIGNRDNFVAKLDDSGNFTFAVSFGSSGFDIANAVIVDNLCNVITTGAYPGTIDMDPGAGVSNFVSLGSNDIFIQKLNGCTSPLLPTITTPSNSLVVCDGQSASLSATSSGSVSWYNVPTGGSSLSNNFTYITSTLTPGTYTYYAEGITCTTSALRTSIIVTVSACTSLNENNPDIISLKVYPNPTKSEMIIFQNEDGAELKLINTLGQVILETKLAAGNNYLTISSLPSGIYYLKASLRSKNAITKIIKQ